MPNKATPTNPIILYYSGDVPSMKNEHEIHYHEGKPSGIGRSKNVKIFFRKAGDVFREQIRRQGVDEIPYPTMVGAFVHFGVYISPKNRKDKSNLPSQDVDNMYTSVQETWQGLVLKDDVQIVTYTTGRFPVSSQAQEFVIACLWELETDKCIADPKYPFDMTMEFYQSFYKPKTFLEVIGAIKNEVSLHPVGLR